MTSEDAPRPEQSPQVDPVDPADLAASFFHALQTTLAASVSAIDAIGANLDRFGAKRSEPVAAPNEPAAADLAPIVGRAMLAAAGSSVRYWRDLAALAGRHQGSLLRAAGVPGELNGQQNRIAADELRAFLREAGDVATLEAQRLRQDLVALGEAVADRLAQPEAGTVRRWRAKP